MFLVNTTVILSMKLLSWMMSESSENLFVRTIDIVWYYYIHPISTVQSNPSKKKSIATCACIRDIVVVVVVQHRKKNGIRMHSKTFADPKLQVISRREKKKKKERDDDRIESNRIESTDF